MTLLLLLASFLDADVNRLGAEDYDRREAAHARLASYGLLAVPALQRGLAHESPEVRSRCDRLLGPHRMLVWDVRAARVLTGPAPPDAKAFWQDHTLRVHTYRLAVRLGCDPGRARAIHPGHDDWWAGWWMGADWVPWGNCLSCLERCRARIANPDTPIEPDLEEWP